jgi:hypothetical protein
MLFWRLLNKYAEKKLEKMGYKKLNIDDSNFAVCKYIRKVNKDTSLAITIYRSDRFIAKKIKTVLNKTEKGYRNFNSHMAFSSDEMCTVGIILKYLDNSFLID